jgi:hypothetical protein
MRLLILSPLILLSVMTTAQDKKLLKKQLTDIMVDYPNQFQNLKKDPNSFFLKFQISGTDDNAMIMGSGKNTYINAFLSTPGTDTEAKNLFEKWVALLNSISLNGAALISSDCKMNKVVYCRVWKIDNSENNISPLYLSFTIKVKILKFNNSFAAALAIGNF